MSVRIDYAVPAAVAPPPGHPRFGLVDSLRAIAVLGVVGFHVGSGTGVFDRGRSGPFVRHLDVGVALFFAISGFLLYRPYAAARLAGRPRPALLDFARRRVLRIVPAYWVALTVAALVVPYAIWQQPWVYYGFGQVYSNDFLGRGLIPAWSLCCEVVFYALLPLYAGALDRWASRRQDLAVQLRGEALVLVGLALASVAIRCVLFAGDVDRFQRNENWTKTAFTTFDWFALGMGLALASVWAQRRGRAPSALAPLVRRPWGTWLAAVVVFVAVCVVSAGWLGDAGLLLGELVTHLGYGAIAFLALVPAVFEGDRRSLVRRILAWRWLSWLGLISYGIFLWHLPVIEVLRSRLSITEIVGGHPFLPVAALTLMVTIACAAASYYAVERPLLRLKYRRPA